MAIILSIFDNKLGPKPYIKIPDSISDELAEKVSKIMDFYPNDNEIFVQEYPEDDIKVINLLFSIPNPMSRGRRELVLISIISAEKSPPITKYKSFLERARDELLELPEIYFGFYKNSNPEYLRQVFETDDLLNDSKIEEKHAKIIEILNTLDGRINLEKTDTHALLLAFSDIKNHRKISVPSSAFKILAELIEKKQDLDNIFIVFRQVGDAMRVDLIPSSDKVLKLKIIVSQLTKEVIMATSDVIKLPLLYTSGICQERTGKCSYEAFFSFKGDFSAMKTRIESELSRKPFIESIECSLLKTS
ncbi:MAG: hypothetical protein ACTSVI_07420 [Promethearchaeota archaeon]